MLQKDLNAENKEIMRKAYEIYEAHGFQDGNSFVDWLEAEKQTGQKSRLKNTRQVKNILLTIVGILSVIVVILLLLLFKKTPMVTLSETGPVAQKITVLVLDPQADERVLVFGDTHFDFDEYTLTQKAKTLLDEDVQLLKDNPETDVRMAGYTSAQGSEETNQKLSEERANAVRDHLIKKGIAPERITTIGYGRTKPAVYEVTPGDIDSKEAKANMRVLFEVVVK